MTLKRLLIHLKRPYFSSQSYLAANINTENVLVSKLKMLTLNLKKKI
jgi:hypothetical protein